MKISAKTERGMKFEAENPDEALKAYHRKLMQEALVNEFAAFMEEVFVAMRQCEPGQSKVLESRPIRIEVSRAPFAEAVEAKAE